MFGYYLEVTNSFKNLVPDYYTRKQTLANAERYTTDRLKELEETILGAEDRLSSLEYELFCTGAGTQWRERWPESRKPPGRWQPWTYSLPFLRWLKKNRYVRPKLNQKGED